MNANQEVDRTLAHQAAEWLTVLKRTATRQELADFAAWLKTSPRHVRDFLVVAAIEKELHHVDAEGRYGAHELGAEVSSNVHILKDTSTLPHARSHKRRWAAAAAFAVIALSATIVSWQSVRLGRSYATEVGEQRAVELEDGSIVHLNTHSRIKVHLSAGGRDIELVRGEVLFKVHRDPARPFRVHSQDAVIQAVGTQFNVYRRPQETTVSVLEGKVALTPDRLPRGKGMEELAAGEEARIASDGKILKHKSPDLAKAMAWRQRRLMFDRDSLADMVREFNRYNKSPQFRLDGAQVEMRHYTGIFDADDPESLVQLLSAEPDLSVERNGEEIAVRSR